MQSGAKRCKAVHAAFELAPPSLLWWRTATSYTGRLKKLLNGWAVSRPLFVGKEQLHSQPLSDSESASNSYA